MYRIKRTRILNRIDLAIVDPERERPFRLEGWYQTGDLQRREGPVRGPIAAGQDGGSAVLLSEREAGERESSRELTCATCVACGELMMFLLRARSSIMRPTVASCER